MLLTISTEPPAGADWPATDLGYLLAKNPARVQRFELPNGVAHVFYPEAEASRCTAALLVEIDPIGLMRSASREQRHAPAAPALAQYVNDRPYAASSLLSVAIARVFGSALRGACVSRPELAASALPLRISVPAVPVSVAAGEDRIALVRRLFEPLGWQVTATQVPLDDVLAERWDAALPTVTNAGAAWRESPYVDLELVGTQRLSAALSHLYVLLPVLDSVKHYRMSPDEVDKLLRVGEGWLAEHPERAFITRRYLRHRRALITTALHRLAEADGLSAEAIDAAAAPEEAVELTAADAADDAANDKRATLATANSTEPDQELADSQSDNPARTSLARERRRAVLDALREIGAARVADLGCGEGALLRELLADPTFTEVLGVDVSAHALRIARRRLRVDKLPERVARRLTIRQGALTYTDAGLRGYDAAVLMEVIEHVDLPRLAALESAVFGHARPNAVVVTTPNAEYNVRWETLPAGHARHADHRFEWRRDEFAAWAGRVAQTHGYRATIRPVGPEDAEVGAPTQLALFTRRADEETS
jgi:2-polyprenyl-3-methyl-5-hydroxy-6-metoxy-1,4-benzoquinol methylase